MKLPRISALFVLATAALAACGDGGTDVDDLTRGEFEGRVTGEFSQSLSGDAISDFDPSFGDQILLSDLDAEIFIAQLDDQFFEGRRSLANGTNPSVTQGVVAFIFFSDTQRLFIAESGTIDIENITSAGIEGTVDFQAVEVDPETFAVLVDEVSVEAAFRTDDSPGALSSRSPAGALRFRLAPAN